MFPPVGMFVLLIVPFESLFYFLDSLTFESVIAISDPRSEHLLVSILFHWYLDLFHCSPHFVYIAGAHRQSSIFYFFKMSYSHYLAVFHYLCDEHFRLGQLSYASWLRGDPPLNSLCNRWHTIHQFWFVYTFKWTFLGVGMPPGPSVINFFTMVIYCHSMVILSFCVIKQHYLGN